MRALALNDDVLNFVHDARVIVFSLDLTGKISVWNRQAAFLTGYSAEDIVGSPLQVKVETSRKFKL
jgi:PAS domain S-box-containing protein